MVLVIIVCHHYLYTLLHCAFSRRKGEENVIPKQVEGSRKLEIIWTVISYLAADYFTLCSQRSSQYLKLADVKRNEGQRCYM